MEDINKGKEKEQEDVLPYLQNAVLEQQSVESGPLPIHRLDVRTTASSITTATTPSSPTKRAKEGGDDVLPYLQNAVLEQHTGGGDKPLQIQRLDGSLSDTVPGARSPRSGTQALASAFGAATTGGGGGGGKGAAPPPPPLLHHHQPPPLQLHQQATTSAGAAFTSSSSPLSSLHHGSSPSASAASTIFAAQQPPPFDHHHALSTTLAAASASGAGAATCAPSVLSATHHAVQDAHQYHHDQPQHIASADHGLGGHGGYDGHHIQATLDGHHDGGFDSHQLGHHAVTDGHAGGAFDINHHHVVDAHAMPSIGLGINRNHSAADAGNHTAGGHFDSHLEGHGGHAAHAVDNHHAAAAGFDSHFAGGGHHAAGVDLHHVAQPPVSGHHVADTFVAATAALSSQPTSHHALVEYNYGGGHHVPDFTTGGGGGGGGGGGAAPSHHAVLSPPHSFRSGSGLDFAPGAFAPAAAPGGGGGPPPGAGQSLRAAAPSPDTVSSKLDVRQPSVAVLVLLLIIIPVLSLSPYWGYHGPSTVSAFMMDEFGISYLDLGLMFSLYSLPNLFMPFIAGSLIDKWGLSLSSLLFNILCLLGNILLAITFYMPEKPISLLLISRVVFGFGGEAIIMCQQVMLARWFSGTLLVVASGFVQIFVLCLGSGGAFLFLPHFDQDGVNISLLHVLFVSFWGFVFNLFYVALEWKWTPFLIAKFLSERQQQQQAARAPEGNLLPLSRPATPGYETTTTTTTTYARPSPVDTRTSAATTTQQSHLADPSLPAGGHLALAPADSDAGFGSGFFADGHHAAISDNHHIPPADTHHALFSGGGGGGGCMGGGGGHHVIDNAHLAHHAADFGPFDGHHALNAGGHHLDLHHATDAYSHTAPAQPTPRYITPSPAPPQLSLPTPTAGASLAAVGDVEDWGYFRIEGRAQIVTREGREEWDNITIEGGGRIGRQGGRRVVDAAAPGAPVSSLVGGLRNRFRGINAAPSPALAVRPPPASPSAAEATTTPTTTPTAADASPAVPFLFYPRVFTSKTVGEDLQSLPLVYWLVACMLFCVAPVLPAFTAFAPLFLQDKFGLGAVASSRAASLVYCVGAGAPFAAFVLAKLRVRSFVQLLTLGGVAGFFLAFYFSGDDGFLPWFFMAGLGLLYCFVLGNGYAWVELTVPRELLGTATALSLAITNAGMALAPFVVGLLRELSSDFDTALLGLLGFVAAGFFFASLVLVVDIAGQGVLIGAQPETVEAERVELRRLRALKRALLDADEAKVRQRERDAAEEREIEAEVRAEVEREVRRRRTERTQQRLPQPQPPLPLATSSSSSSSSVSPSAVVSSSSSSSSSSLSAAGVTPSFSSVRAAERTPLLSSQQRTRLGGPASGEKHVV